MSYSDFIKLLEEEKCLYLGVDEKQQKQMKRSKHKRYMIWKYLYYFRNCQYWGRARGNSDLNRVHRHVAKYKHRYYDKKRNQYSGKAGIEIGVHCNIGRNCDIWHSGVIINGNIGDNCIFHGNNVIGNKGIGKEKDIPVIGNQVDIGAGTIVIGNIKIADCCKIGAGAVVTQNFPIANSIIVGVPGKVLS